MGWKGPTILAIAFFVVIFLIPWVVLWVGSYLDLALSIQPVTSWLLTRLLPPIPIVFGLAVGFWAVIVLWRDGGGTPNPLAPTIRIVTSGPYAYCRNPLSPSVAVYVSGIALWFGSIMAVLIIFSLIIVLLVLVWIYEEEELLARFGEDYVRYRASTPFLIPNIGRSNNSNE
jgi:protein-S-isoprenylcysteine O-methyltransferase Ste14